MPQLTYHIETPLFCNRLCDECRYHDECDYVAMKEKIAHALMTETASHTGVLDIDVADILDGMNDTYKKLIQLEPDEEHRLFRSILFGKITEKSKDIHPLLIHARSFKKGVYQWMHRNEPVIPRYENGIERIRNCSMYMIGRIEQVLVLQDVYGQKPGVSHYINGCAKAALVMLDDIIRSWKELLSMMPEKDCTASALLDETGSLLRRVEKQFPQARAFLRPGLDE